MDKKSVQRMIKDLAIDRKRKLFWWGIFKKYKVKAFIFWMEEGMHANAAFDRANSTDKDWDLERVKKMKDD